MNGIAPLLDGATSWIVGDAGYPVPSGVEVDPAPDQGNTIRIMAIGSSFTADALEQYLYEIFADRGYNAIIGNCYIGGCTIEKHWTNEMSSNASTKNSNSYRKIKNGIKTTTANKSIAYILQDEPWDYVVYQQGAGLYGVIESHHPYIENFNAYIKNYLKEGSYKTGYQLTWAFPKDCTNYRFDIYDKDQDKMYAACVACAKSLLDEGYVDMLIPTGTSVQNGRQTSLGDTFNRDWGHLNYDYGRYTASLTWFEATTGIDATTVTWKPATVTEAQAVICRKAVHDAILRPYEVTK